MRNGGAGPVAPGVIGALRDATRSRHANLGASPAMSRLFDPGYTVPEYRAHLGRLLGLFEPLERAVAPPVSCRASHLIRTVPNKFLT